MPMSRFVRSLFVFARQGRLGLVLMILALSARPPMPSAEARGGAGRTAVVRNLLEKGIRSLMEADRARRAKEPARAARHAKVAERYFLDVLSQDPDNIDAAMRGVQAAVFAGDLRGAARWEERYRFISRRGEADPDLHFLHAFVHLFGTQRPERALRSLQRMYSLDPRARSRERDNLWFEALDIFGHTLLAAGKYDLAIAQFKTGMRITRRQGNRARELLMISNVGVTLMRDGRFIEAADIYEALIKLQPKNPVWHWQLGLCFAAQSKFNAAVPVYREVMRLMAAGHVPAGGANDLRQVRLRLGNCLRIVAQRHRDPEEQQRIQTEAQAEIRAYIESAPQDSLGHKWLGVLLFKDLDKPYEALPHLKKAFQLDPICVDALKYMLQIHKHYDPPPEQLPPDDPAAAEKARAAWRAVIEPWQRDIEEGEARRKKVQEERRKKTGKSGCT